MKNTLIKDDKILCLKQMQFKRNSIVLLINLNQKSSIKRLVAMPEDTIYIKNSIVYVNHYQVKSIGNISYAYTLSSDSVQKVLTLLNDNSIDFNQRLSPMGVFQFNADEEELVKVKRAFSQLSIRKSIEFPAVSSNNNVIFHPALYWNKDNLGPIVIPAKGSRVRISKKFYMIYKKIIEQETGKKLEFHHDQAYLGKTPLHSYTFTNNYYFLINDNWESVNDSRTIGFVPESQILSRYWFKLPW